MGDGSSVQGPNLAYTKHNLPVSVSRTCKHCRDDEDWLDARVALLHPGWHQINECYQEGGVIEIVCVTTNECKEIRECSSFNVCDIYVLEALAGKMFRLTYRCGKKEVVRPLLQRVFH